MPWPPVVPPATRGNSTPQVNAHPNDHNAISVALSEIVTKIDVLDDPHDHNSLYSAIAHDHAGVYSVVAHTHEGIATNDHNHNSVYSTLSHNHDGSYSSTGHTHAPGAHDHDAEYAALDHDGDHLGTYWGLWTGNQAAYDALGSYSDNVLYVIV